MRRILVAVCVALAAAGAASADTFRVVPSAPRVLASAETPNQPGQIALPLELLRPPSTPAQLSLPQLQELWQRAGAAYGIPWQVLGSINKVESNFGRNMGPSSAGAIGWMQFMPDTWLRWGIDANGDGIADPWSPEDAVFSAARYLAAAGGRTDLQRAVFAYNHAQWYVDEVLALARTYSGGLQVAAGLDSLQLQVEQARAAVVAASNALDAAVAAEQKLRNAEVQVQARADAAQLLSDQLELAKAAADVGGKAAAAHAVVERRRADLEAAQQGLDSARASAQTASFDTGARTLLSGANYAGDGYVFPVGGGPGVVSVAHTHHDYPAADIAAPAGAPLYALADGVVSNAWTGDPRCGTGFTYRTGDGQTWTYCHLAYLDPGVREGAFLSAGAQVGLVGSTGDATGPHLHLQLQPANAYPQEEAWFQSFAGAAFTWQDADPAPSDGPGVVFAAPAPAAAPRQSDGGFGAPAAPEDGVVLFTR